MALQVHCLDDEILPLMMSVPLLCAMWMFISLQRSVGDLLEVAAVVGDRHP